MNERWTQHLKLLLFQLLCAFTGDSRKGYIGSHFFFKKGKKYFTIHL